MTVQDGPIDWQDVLKITNNKFNLAKEMVTMLGDELPEMQKIINLAYREKEYATLLERVHKLHGSCCYCGVPHLKKITATLEAQLKKQDYKELPTLILQMNQEIQGILKYINEKI